MLGSSLVDPNTGETFLKRSMKELLKDWTGGCSALAGNPDVIKVLLQVGIIDAKNLRILALRVAQDSLDETALATVIHEFLKNRRVRIRLQRHALKYHKIPRRQAKNDLKDLEAETADIMRRAGLSPWGSS
jgi:hypothetical protein